MIATPPNSLYTPPGPAVKYSLGERTNRREGACLEDFHHSGGTHENTEPLQFNQGSSPPLMTVQRFQEEK